MLAFDAKKNNKYILFTAKSDQFLTSNCVYFYEQKVLFDPGNPAFTPSLLLKMREYGIDPLEIRHIICTHLHLDHIGAYWLFPNATLYASDEEIKALLTHNRYFAVDNYIYSEAIRKSLLQGVKFLTQHPYERALTSLSKFMNRFSYTDELADGRNGYYVFPSHTPGSAIIVFEKTVLMGDVFSMDKALEWIPRKFGEKIEILHAVRSYGKANLIPGHSQIIPGMVKKAAISNNLAFVQTACEESCNDIYRHINCDDMGRISSECYFDSLGNRVLHKDGIYTKKFYYNNIGRISKEVYLDANENPIADVRGRYGAQYNYDENGRWILLIDLDNNYQLRRANDDNYFASIYCYSLLNTMQMAARVDFNGRDIIGIRYFLNGYKISPQDAYDLYADVVYKLEMNLLD